jgi:hypothetical protein
MIVIGLAIGWLVCGVVGHILIDALCGVEDELSPLVLGGAGLLVLGLAVLMGRVVAKISTLVLELLGWSIGGSYRRSVRSLRAFFRRYL